MSKSLRLGVVIGDQIVDERLVREARAVRLGELGERPRSWKMFEAEAGGWRLRLAEGMEARLADGEHAPTAVQGPALVALSSTTRGKVVLGEATLLFQMVTAPPPAPAPRLPKSVRGSLGSRIDPVMTAVLVFSFLAHTGFGAWVYGMDVPREPQAEQAPEAYAVKTIPIPRMSEALPEAEGRGPTAPAPAPASKKPGRKPSAEPGVEEFHVGETALIKVLGRKSGEGGRFVDVTGGKEVGENLGRSLERGKDRKVEAPELLGPGERKISDGAVSGPVGPSEPTGVGPRTGEEIVPDGEVQTPEPIAGGIDPAEVMATIKTRYYRGIAECYRLTLKKDAKAGGKLILGLGIGAGGRVTRVDVQAFDRDLEQCVEDRARTWRFASGKDGDEVVVPILLRPGH
jgi:hypothetical protein